MKDVILYLMPMLNKCFGNAYDWLLWLVLYEFLR
jgi:hypothetical protein